MHWYVMPTVSSGVAPTSLLWFDLDEAVLLLTVAVAVAALAVLGAAILAARRRPIGWWPSGRPRRRASTPPRRVLARRCPSPAPMVRRSLAVVLAAVAVAAPVTARADAGCRQVTVDLTVTWDPDRAETVSGVVTRLRYPAALELPTRPGTESASARVETRTGTAGGLFDALRKDTDGDGAGDLLNVGLITQGIRPGEFARVRFDCRPGASTPSAAAFACTPDVADESGAVPAQCSVEVVAS